jgi:hypothetical protein
MREMKELTALAATLTRSPVTVVAAGHHNINPCSRSREPRFVRVHRR